MSKKNKGAKNAKPGDISTNKKALRDYTIIDKYEAGIVLVGTEVKSIRAGKSNLRDAFARIDNDQAFLHGLDIPPWENASHTQHAAKAPRKLLLHRKEIEKIRQQIDIKGNAFVALRMYWSGRRVKVALGIGKGKTHVDQREDIKARTQKRETDRELAHFERGRK